jgi:hypothetical protein
MYNDVRAAIGRPRVSDRQGDALTYLLLSFLGLVILAGESFKVRDVNVAGLVLLMLVLQLVLVALSGDGLRLRLVDLPLLTIAAVFGAVGVARYDARDVFEDAVPFVVFALTMASLTTVSVASRLRVCRFVVVVSALAFAKMLAIAYLNVEPAWGGNTFWQGSRRELGSGTYRVFLKGGDVFISVAATMLLASLMLRGRSPAPFGRPTTVLLCIPLLAAVVMSYTRATIGAIALALLVWPALLYRTGIVDLRRAAVVVLLIASGALASLQMAALARGRALDGPWGLSYGSIGVASAVQRFGEGGDLALAYRQLETAEALEVAGRDGYLGSGLGAHFYTPFSGSRKEDGRSLYAHHLPAWLTLKVGIAGAVVFYGTLWISIGATMRHLRCVGQSARDNQCTGVPAPVLAASLAALLFLMFNDLLNNKFVTVSGAAAYGLILSLRGRRPPGEGAAGSSTGLSPVGPSSACGASSQGSS